MKNFSFKNIVIYLMLKTAFINFLLLYLIFSQINNVFAQSSLSADFYSDIKFERLSIEHGLSQITVHAILQDSKGFLWFGTEDGLNRFDGYNFITFRHDDNDSTSISDNFIWSITEDKFGYIWIGTNGGGLSKYNYLSNSFTNYLHNPKDKNSISENNIRKIFEDSDGKLWIGTNSSGLCKFDYKTNKFTRISSDGTPNSLSSDNIRFISEDENKNLWIATDGGGLNKFERTANKFTSYKSFVFNNRVIQAPVVWSLLNEGDIVWIGTYENGLIKYNSKSGKVENHFSRINENSLIQNNITYILKDASQHLWICTEAGLSILNASSGKFYNYRHNISDIKSIGNNIIRCAYKDKSNLIWLGTFGGGASKINLNKKFKVYSHDPSDINSVSHNMIRAIYQDSRKFVWVGTLGNGLNLLNKEKNKFEHFAADNTSTSISNNIITSIWEDNEKNLWVGTWGGGLNKIKLSVNPNKEHYIKEINYFLNDPNNKYSISSNIVQAIFQDSKENLWVGTESGLDKYQKSNNRFIRYASQPNDNNSLSDNRIQSKCIIEDKHGNIWVGTWRGLNRLRVLQKNNSNKKEEIIFERFLRDAQDINSLSDNRVVSLYEDELRSKTDTTILWIGTVGGGLNKLEIINSETSDNEAKFKFTHYTEKDGLPNNVVYGILGDKNGNIWLSTNNGISKFNPEQEIFRNYDISDGLQSNQFFWGAFHETRDGELFFGGINGLNSFYPGELKENTYIPPVYITDCEISDSKNENYKLNSYSQPNSISLSYDSYAFSFEFAALDFTTPEKNQYEYILDGYDEEWKSAGGKNVITYSNISDGDYTFKVRGSNNDKVWNQQGASVQIKILTPFWKTWAFVAVVFLTFLGLGIYFVTAQIKNILAVERLRTKIAADLHDNIGSSLTEISILSEVISTRLNGAEKDVQKSLGKISTKSRDLIDKMSDIVWLVNPKRDSLYDLILRLQDTYSELLADTNISFRSDNLKALENVSLQMEHRQHLFLIFKEAINNCITHSNCSEIYLNAKVNGRKLEMELSDNGNGYERKTSQGNGLDNMENRAELIGGKLYINSSLGNGTTVKYIGSIS
ncbi:MAG: hypothetical protein A2068_09545 [Ignavibacteria bacterium GWB2_35_6b]|nr:MAG: hypothetical protein A2068_09545 [Ignavibacteria bacterium GWB2_35_6b]